MTFSSVSALPEYEAEQQIKFSTEKVIDIGRWNSTNFKEYIKPELDKIKNEKFVGKVYISGEGIINSSFDLNEYNFDIIFKSNIEIKIDKSHDYNIGGFICDNVLSFIYIGCEEEVNVTLEKIHLKDTAFFYFEDTKLSLSVQDIVNTGRCIFEGSGHSLDLKLENTDFGYCIFNGIELNSLYLENIILSECIFNGVKFPEYLEDVLNNDEKQKDNYRQLKHVMDKNGNHTEANKFYALEMEYYEKSLGVKKKGFCNTILEILKTIGNGLENKKRGEKIILLFSELITEHGTNFIRGIYTLLIFTLISASISTSYVFLAIEHGEDFCTNINLTCSTQMSHIIVGILIIPLVMLMAVLLDLVITFLSYIGSKTAKNKKKEPEEYYFFDILSPILLMLYIVLMDLLLPLEYYIHGVKYVFEPFRHFISLFDPTYGIFRSQVTSYNSLELMFFTIYKICYGIILWHIIVAAKRTTKR